jgi:hypothetical protein
MKKTVFVFLLLTFFIKADTIPEIRYEDKVRIAEVYKIAEFYRDKIWENWDKAPFALLLVYDENEFLINHPSPSDDFNLTGFDSHLNSKVYYRHRVFNKQFLATFPAVNGLSTIVVGTPENTGKSSIDWIITILHEHFHQHQNSQPDYYSSVERLNLSEGDETGMWMLNYPFPYEDEKINAVYDSAKKSLANIFKNKNESRFKDLYDKFRKRRYNLIESFNEKDYKYFSFQLWQEGIARYTEIKLMQFLLEDNYIFSKEVQKLADYKPLKDHYSNYYLNALDLLNGLSLSDSKRNCFYAFGAFEGLLLDNVNMDWKKNYFDNKFFIEKYYPD